MANNAQLDRDYESRIASDPVMQQLLQEYNRDEAAQDAFLARARAGEPLDKLRAEGMRSHLAPSPVRDKMNARLAELGIDTTNWQLDLDLDKSGTASRVGVDHQNFFEKHGDTLARWGTLGAMGAVAAPFIVGGLTGGGAAGAGGAGAAGSGGAGAGVGAAAATGGGFGWRDILGMGADVGGALSDMSAGRADGRQEEWNAEMDRVRAQAMLDQVALNRRQLNQNSAVRGNLMQGIQDVNIEAPAGIPRGKISGGLRPSAIPDRASIGADMERQAREELLNPPDRSISDPPAPNGFDSFLNAAGPILGLGNLFTRRRANPGPVPTGGINATTGPTGIHPAFRGVRF